MKKTSSMFACREGRCRRHLSLGRAALISRGRTAGIYYFPARGTLSRLNAQLPLPIPSSAASARELPRAFAAFDSGHGSRGGALAQVFAQSAILALIRQCVGVSHEQLLATLLRPASRAEKASWSIAAMIGSTESVVIGSLLDGWSGLVSRFRRSPEPRHRRKNRVPRQRQQKLAGDSLLAGAGGGDL